ncbi:hypothetical protein BEN49_16965 [Hymenobacter coccineus]|uniref:Carboxypeptidase-like regulatory domain-containing protein n=1 Tax=Hymenobacter coccineus TaxID=1908235 RepID=A0A1G1TN05_9BACT|nr:hypothetical protein BEN49_16965 [Hymenobacter coccineus]
MAVPATAQVTIHGTVRDSLTGKPLPFASVFLLNTTYGVTADQQGAYVLPGIQRGRYDVSASYLGYRLRQRPLLVADATSLTLNFGLLPAPAPLGEVVVRPVNRLADYQLFLRLFLGTSSFAQLCRVRDPGDIRVIFDPDRRRLTARATRPVQVDNGALGYRLTYYDLDFRADITDETVTILTVSRVAFQSLPPLNADGQRRWEANRQKAYRGSYLHFLRSAYAGQLAEEGFLLQRLQRRPNRRRAATDSLVRRWQAAGRNHGSLPDSVWRLLGQSKVLSLVYKPRLPLDSVRTATAGRVWLRFRDLLAVTYENARPDPNFHAPGAITGHPLPSHQESILQLRPPPAVELAPNAVPVAPLSLVTEGYWSFEKMAELLPLDYFPPE